MKITFLVLFATVIIVLGEAGVLEHDRDVCLQPIVQGHCLALIPRFAYDASLDKCVSFIYGGCNGNSNRFGFKEDCETLCVINQYKSYD